MSEQIKNLSIRRSGMPVADVYDTVVNDYREAFSAFDGVSFETIPETEDIREKFLIYIDSGKQAHIEITTTNNNRVIMRLYNSDKENDNISIGSVANNSYASYIIVRTAYGVAFSPVIYYFNAIDCIDEGYLQCFFTEFKDENGKAVSTIVYNDTDSEKSASGSISIVSAKHDYLEKISNNRLFNGSVAAHTVLSNAFSYLYPLVSDNLYKKLQAENGKFGLVELCGRKYISGSQFCLLYEED